MRRTSKKTYLAACLSAGLIAIGMINEANGQCTSCDGEQKVKFRFNGVASISGHADVKISYGDQVFWRRVPATGEAGSKVLDNGCWRPVYACAFWDAEIAVEPKLDQPVKIEYIYTPTPNENCPPNPDYTAFEPNTCSGNPVTFWSRPSSKCLKVWVAGSDGKWVLEPPLLINSGTTPNTVFYIKGILSADDSNVGDSTGPVAGGGQPQADVAELIDTPSFTIGSGDCPVSCAAAGQSSTGGSQGTPSSVSFRPATHIAGLSSGSGVITDEWDEPSVSQSGGASGAGAGNGYSVSVPIGRLRWEMSLGSISRATILGRLIYQADNLSDAATYSPARLSLAAGSDPERVVPSGADLSQVKLREGLGLVDIQTVTYGFTVAVYDESDVNWNPGTGRYDIDVGATPLLTWTVDNPDGASLLGKVRFTKTEGANSEVHLAQWVGTAQSSGTMTISRYDGKWKEVRDYSLLTSPNRRVETISLYKNIGGTDVLQHKVKETYQEFYNWGESGDVFEAMVELVQDPGGKNLTTSFVYWDFATQPGNLLYQVTFPDGYPERIPFRVSETGGAAPPAVPVGTPNEMWQPFRDFNNFDDTNPKRVTVNTFDIVSGAEVHELNQTYIGTAKIAERDRGHVFEDGFWKIKTTNWVDNYDWPYSYEEEWLDIGSRRLAFSLDSQGRTRDIYYDAGFWDPINQVFSVSGTGDQALQTTTLHGMAGTEQGIANKTTVDVTVEDSFGRTVLEESYVTDGNWWDDNETERSTRLINRKVHTYTDGRLTSTEQNGRLVYESDYYPDGRLEWEEDESGRRTEYVYDEMHRVQEKTIRGRDGDSDQDITYEYDVLGNVISETRFAGGLSIETQWTYDLTGELESTTGPDGLTTEIETDYSTGHKVVTETLPTQATRITSYYKDRQIRNITGTAVEDEYRIHGTVLWVPGSYREAVAMYRDSVLTQLKSLRAVNWVGDEIFFQTPQFQGAGYRDRYTYYDLTLDSDGYLYTRQLVIAIDETGRDPEIFTYDELGRLAKQGFDRNGNWVLDDVPVSPDPPEPITTYDRQFQKYNGTGPWEDVSTVERYLQDNSATKTLVKRTRNRVPAALTGDEVFKTFTELPGGGITVATLAIDRTDTSPTFGDETFVIDDQEHGQVWTRVERDGLLRSEIRPGVPTARTYTYTPLGEIESIYEPITDIDVSYSYDPSTRQLSAMADSLSRQTEYEYFPAGVPNAGKIKRVRDPVENWTYFDYYPSGQLFRQWGVNAYPVEYAYNEAGNTTTMKTWRTTPGAVNWDSATWPDPPGGDLTEWIYDSPSGLLERKRYADAGSGQKTVIYTYNSGHFLDTKVNGRNQTIDYGFNTMGQLQTVTYPDGTPPVTLGYDRGGRLKSATDAVGTHSVSWTDRDQMEDEDYTAGLLNGVKVDRTFDSQYRLGRIEFKQGSVTQTRERFVYDSISWLDYIVDENADGSVELRRYDYTFKSGTPLIESVAFSEASTPVMTQSYDHDEDRLDEASATLAGGATVYGVSYEYDDLNRRFEAHLAGGTEWDYGYNDRSEVTSGKRLLPLEIPVGGKQFEYNYDDIGNRLVARFGGDETGANLSESVYNPANALNQLTSRTVPGAIWLAGEAPDTLTLLGAVQGQAFDIERQDDGRFFGKATVNNASSPVFARVAVAGKNGSTLTDFQSGNRFVPKNPEAFGYDADGNLTSDGSWTYEWDAESRLKKMRSLSGSPAPERRIEFVYDWQGRRVRKTVWNDRDDGQGTELTDLLFVYDGWNLIAELNANAGNAKVRTYMWGLDLSGSTQGAAGVGGLLAETFYSGPEAGTYFPSFDGNGNVMALTRATDGATRATYEYGPFGELLRATGPLALSNPFRFSTKYQDEETDLLYYGYRYLKDGRWLSRDPIAENGGVNLYGFVANNPVSGIDLLGLALYAFDGTGNNNREVSKGKFTWVLVLAQGYRGEAHYENGVGSSFGMRAIGGLTGLGGRARLENAYQAFLRNYNSGDKEIDIIGFSRGAAMAREFANMIYERGDGSGKRTVTTQMGKGSITQTVWGKPCKIPDIRYVGLFDTVGSFGVPGNQANIGYNLGLPPNVKSARQAVAADEQRYLFPLTPLGSGGDGQDFGEQPFPGDHSDIGRGHGTDTRDLSYAPLQYIWSGGIAVGVPFGPLPDFTFTGNTTPHDLSSGFPYNIFPKRPR